MRTATLFCLLRSALDTRIRFPPIEMTVFARGCSTFTFLDCRQETLVVDEQRYQQYVVVHAHHLLKLCATRLWRVLRVYAAVFVYM